ncbi:MAG: hypothetical protein JWM86_1709 [Thermoleophilia bacterium]|nr:hypothetical protein [Thermoleophilia bacterium]
MGDFGGLRSAALGVVATGVVAGVTLQLTGSRAAEDRAARLRHNDGVSASKWQRAGDDLGSNLDGALRTGVLAIGAGSLAAAGVGLLTRRPWLVGTGLGIAVGAAGSVLLTGSGSPADRIAANTHSIASTWSGQIHRHLSPQRPDVDAMRPVASTEAPRPRPAAAAIERARLTLAPGVPDEARAQADAAKALAQIDWSRPDIVLWMPGTNEHVMAGNWKRVASEELARPSSAVLVDYPATMDFEQSVSTGMRTLQLVLAGIASHGGDHRVLAGGYSQGAWIIGDAMATPEIRDAIDRAALFGHPGLARRHFDDRSDPKVLEANDAHDPVAFAVPDRQLLIDASRDMARGEAATHPIRAINAIAQNPELSGYWGVRMVDGERWAGVDPHEYYGSYEPALRWLDEAPLPRDD